MPVVAPAAPQTAAETELIGAETCSGDPRNDPGQPQWHAETVTARARGAGGPAQDERHAGRVSDETIARLEQAMGALGTAAITSMDRRLLWFRAMSAENRSWLGLVAQAGVAAFVDWIKHPERTRPAVAGEVFGTAPRELARAVTLQQAVEMVRVIVDVVEAQVDDLAAPGGEAELREAVLRYTREIAFGTARSTRAPRRRAAPGTPGSRPWSSTHWCGARSTRACSRGPRP